MIIKGGMLTMLDETKGLLANIEAPQTTPGPRTAPMFWKFIGPMTYQLANSPPPTQHPINDQYVQDTTTKMERNWKEIACRLNKHTHWINGKMNELRG